MCSLSLHRSELSDRKEVMIGDKSVTRCNPNYSHSSRKKRKATDGYLEAENGPLKRKTIYTVFTRAYLRNVTHTDVCYKLTVSPIFQHVVVSVKARLTKRVVSFPLEGISLSPQNQNERYQIHLGTSFPVILTKTIGVLPFR